MNKLLVIFILILSTFSSFAQFRPSSQSNYSISFDHFISGVKHVAILVKEEDIDRMNNQYSTNYKDFAIKGIYDYLKAMGIQNVSFTTTSRKDPEFPSKCDLATFAFSWKSSERGYFHDFEWVFFDCNDDSYSFKSNDIIYHSENNLPSYTSSFYNHLNKVFGYKVNYQDTKRLKLKGSSSTGMSENEFKKILDNKSNEFEGIYELTSRTETMPQYRVGVKKTYDGYEIIYFDGAENYLDWIEGDLKAKLTATATENIYKCEWYMKYKSVRNAYITFSNNMFEMILNNESTTYIKLYPTAKSNSSKSSVASGTGFAITSNGIIGTNYHVIDGASKIKIRGINGDFSKPYEAKVLVEDKNNDLALLQIQDSNFYNLGIIPYTISSKPSDVGTSIFVLGYPLRSSMGDEIKLTDGIISSKSGFKGDITSYQISAPIQPGNSGGPLFDKNGNLVGVVNAKIIGAENVSYAIKSSYLSNLFDQLATSPKLQNTSSVNGRSLSEQVKLIKKFTYIIEVN